MSLIQSLLSLASAGVLMLSSALDAAAPQNDSDGYLFLVNRSSMLSDSFMPRDLEQAKVPGSVRRMRKEAAAALEEMFAACREETGVTLISVSGFRSYGTQRNIYRRKLRTVKGDVAKAQEYVAPPGASEHQTGLAMDIGQKNKPHLNASFGETAGGKWARENSWRFGFILRYDLGWEDITGYSFEPWHFRYVGKAAAEKIHASGLPYEIWLLGYRQENLLALLGGSAEVSP